MQQRGCGETLQFSGKLLASIDEAFGRKLPEL